MKHGAKSEADLRVALDARSIPIPFCGCQVWLGTLDSDGYGILYTGKHTPPYYRRRMKAHRVAYELAKGPIPKGLEPDHLCRVPGCINPDHIEAVTRKVNTDRGMCAAVNRKRQLGKTHCPRGHPYSGDTLYVTPKGKRQCRECMRSQWRAWNRTRTQ